MSLVTAAFHASANRSISHRGLSGRRYQHFMDAGGWLQPTAA
jgi:elongation factor P hydroxylase